MVDVDNAIRDHLGWKLGRENVEIWTRIPMIIMIIMTDG